MLLGTNNLFLSLPDCSYEETECPRRAHHDSRNDDGRILWRKGFERVNVYQNIHCLQMLTICCVLWSNWMNNLYRDDFRTANCIAGKGGTHCLVLDRE
jgi:hypothetical protein